MKDAPYELYYWPSIPGRGELVRLALEDAGAPYVDVARLPVKRGGGVAALMKAMKVGSPSLEPFAPPFLKSGELVVAQVANILLYLGPRLELVPADEESRFRAHQLQLTVTDLMAEVHDTHHPVASGLTYEEQKPAAKKRSKAFIADRIPKYLGYFERVLGRGDGKHFVGGAHSYADLSVAHVVVGLRYAFPNAMQHVAPTLPLLTALEKRVAERPRIAAYLTSKRRLPFTEEGIFRHYPELDSKP
jgi:glutathione S-transferase